MYLPLSFSIFQLLSLVALSRNGSEIFHRQTHPSSRVAPILSRTTSTMTNLELKGSWNVIKGNLKQKYAELTDDDLTYIDGKEDELFGRLQNRLGKTKEALQSEITIFEAGATK